MVSVRRQEQLREREKYSSLAGVVHFDRNELDLYRFLWSHNAQNPRIQTGTNALDSTKSWSIAAFEGVPNLAEEVSRLKAAGKISVDWRSPYPHSGNVVIRADDTALEKAQLFEPGALTPVLKLAKRISIKSVDLMMNASPNGNKLNGASVGIDPSPDKKWWRELAEVKMAFGRGLSVFPLSVSPDEFKYKLHNWLNVTNIMCQEGKMSKSAWGQLIEGLKYVQYLEDDAGNPYMAVVAGLNKEDALYVSDYLKKATKSSEVIGLFDSINDRTSFQRLRIAQELSRALGCTVTDTYADSSYINLDPKNAILVSGGVYEPNNGIKPFATGIEGIILHNVNSGDILHPVGTGAGFPLHGLIQLPTGIDIYNLGIADVSDAKIEEVNRLMSQINTELSLRTVGIGYNVDWYKK